MTRAQPSPSRPAASGRRVPVGALSCTSAALSCTSAARLARTLSPRGRLIEVNSGAPFAPLPAPLPAKEEASSAARAPLGPPRPMSDYFAELKGKVGAPKGPLCGRKVVLWKAKRWWGQPLAVALLGLCSPFGRTFGRAKTM